MRNGTGVGEAGRLYAAAHRSHYQLEDLRQALELYKDVIADHPETQEAGYSLSQIQNIVKLVVPKQAFLDAQVDLASAYLEQ